MNTVPYILDPYQLVQDHKDVQGFKEYDVGVQLLVVHCHQLVKVVHLFVYLT